MLLKTEVEYGKKVFIMSSVHSWNDNRIFFKEASSLSSYYRVELHAVGEISHREKNGVNIYCVPRLKRYLRPVNWLRLLWRAFKSRADVYHFHDPELIPLGLFLKIIGKKVVYDIHEDYPDAISHKRWIPKALRKPIAKAFNFFEKKCCSFFDALIFAELAYKDSFRSIATLKEDILNYPPEGLPCVSEKQGNGGKVNLIYAGTISEIRGALQMIEALRHLREKNVGVHLFLVGPIFDPYLEDSLKKLVYQYQLQGCITITGRVDPQKVYDYLGVSNIGLALLHPVQNNLKSLVTKLFEYMSANLAIVASDFPKWRELMEGVGAGVVVDPLDPVGIAAQIQYLANNPHLCLEMGRNGRLAYETRFNWSSEEKKLLALYHKLLID